MMIIDDATIGGHLGP